MNLEDAKGWLVGEKNKGMEAMFLMMNDARLKVGLQGIAMSEISYQNALEFAKERKQIQGKIPYYGASGIIDYVEKPIFSGEYFLIGEDGANLISRSTPIAFIVKGEFWVNNHAHILSTYGDIPLEFLVYYIESISLKPWISGSAQPKLNQENNDPITKLSSLSFSIPFSR